MKDITIIGGNSFAITNRGNISKAVKELMAQHVPPIGGDVLTINGKKYRAKIPLSHVPFTNTTVDEFTLIQQKKSKLSRSKREKVANLFLKYFDEITT